MADAAPSLHHVVFCVRRANQEQAVAFWRDLGFEFVDIDLPDVGLRVMLDWDRGIEVIAPNDDAGEVAAPFVKFLDEHDEGVYSVIVRTADVATPISIAARYGATVEYQQHRDDGGHSLDEAMLSPMHGMRVTFLVMGPSRVTAAVVMTMDADLVYITYTGNPAGVRTLVEMLEEDGLEVDYEPPGEERLFGVESVVNLVLAVTGHRLVWETLNATVQTFRRQVPEAVVDIEAQG